jgi:hypothetical protein
MYTQERAVMNLEARFLFSLPGRLSFSPALQEHLPGPGAGAGSRCV